METQTRVFCHPKLTPMIYRRIYYYLLQGVAADTSTASELMDFQVLSSCCDIF